MTQINMQLNKENEYIGEISRVYMADWILEYLGVNIHMKLEEFDYKPSEEIIFDEELKMYEIEFAKIIKKKKGLDQLEKLGICQYIFDVYIKAKEILNKLQKGKKIKLKNCIK